MKLVAAKCTQCGADIDVDASLLKGCCPFCHTEFLVEQVVNNYIVSSSEEVSNLVKAGEARLLFGEYDIALEKFLKICDLYPQDYRGWLGLIKAKTKNFTEVFSTRNQLDEVLEFYRKAEIVASGTMDKSFSDAFEKYVSKVRDFIEESVSDIQTMIDSTKSEQEANKKQFENQIETIQTKKHKAESIYKKVLWSVPIVMFAALVIGFCWGKGGIFSIVVFFCVAIGVMFYLYIPEIYKKIVGKMDDEISLICISLNSMNTQYNIRINYLTQQIVAKSGKKV